MKKTSAKWSHGDTIVFENPIGVFLLVGLSGVGRMIDNILTRPTNQCDPTNQDPRCFAVAVTGLPTTPPKLLIWGLCAERRMQKRVHYPLKVTRPMLCCRDSRI